MDLQPTIIINAIVSEDHNENLFLRPFCGETLVNRAIHLADKAFPTAQIELLTNSKKVENSLNKTDEINISVVHTSSFEDHFDNMSISNVLALNPHYPILSADHLTEAFTIWTENKQAVTSVHSHGERAVIQSGTGQNSIGKALLSNGAFRIGDVNFIGSNSDGLEDAQLFEIPPYSGIKIDHNDVWAYGERLFHKNRTTRSTLSQLKVFMSDIDGVMTDGSMYYTENGDEIKRFHTADGMGLKKLQKLGLKVGFCTGEDRQLNQRRADKLGLDFIFHGVSDKLSVVKKYCEENGFTLNQVGFIGDDVNDLEILNACGFGACPANAVKEVKAVHGINIMTRSGGTGVLRELVEEFWGVD